MRPGTKSTVTIRLFQAIPEFLVSFIVKNTGIKQKDYLFKRYAGIKKSIIKLEATLHLVLIVVVVVVIIFVVVVVIVVIAVVNVGGIPPVLAVTGRVSPVVVVVGAGGAGT